MTKSEKKIGVVGSEALRRPSRACSFMTLTNLSSNRRKVFTPLIVAWSVVAILGGCVHGETGRVILLPSQVVFFESGKDILVKGLVENVDGAPLSGVSVSLATSGPKLGTVISSNLGNFELKAHILCGGKIENKSWLPSYRKMKSVFPPAQLHITKDEKLLERVDLFNGLEVEEGEGVQVIEVGTIIILP